MLEYTGGQYSEVDFETHLEDLEYYSKKARLLHKINQCNQLLESSSADSKAQIELRLKAYWAELELLTPPPARS